MGSFLYLPHLLMLVYTYNERLQVRIGDFFKEKGPELGAFLLVAERNEWNDWTHVL